MPKRSVTHTVYACTHCDKTFTTRHLKDHEATHKQFNGLDDLTSDNRQQSSAGVTERLSSPVVTVLTKRPSSPVVTVLTKRPSSPVVTVLTERPSSPVVTVLTERPSSPVVTVLTERPSFPLRTVMSLTLTADQPLLCVGRILPFDETVSNMTDRATLQSVLNNPLILTTSTSSDSNMTYCSASSHVSPDVQNLQCVFSIQAAETNKVQSRHCSAIQQSERAHEAVNNNSIWTDHDNRT